MDQEVYSLDASRRAVVLESIRNVCAHRHWRLLAAHVRVTHVHVIVAADLEPERVMNDFKAYASRALNESRLDPSERKRWTRHGSTRYIKGESHLRAVLHYTLRGQGEPMHLFDGTSEPRLDSEPRP
jgi:REP element-mobilizing transposase RayT